MLSTVEKAQGWLRRHRVDAWLLYDYLGANPVFWAVVGKLGMVTRPCWLFVPARGQPRLLVHAVDAGKFRSLGLPLTVFANRAQMLRHLRRWLTGLQRVAMEYSPQGALPRVGRVDAGTVELVRGWGLQVLPSGDLFQESALLWTPAQEQSHREAACLLSAIVLEAFAFLGQDLSGALTEWDTAQFIRTRFADLGLESPEGPIVAVNAHSSDPHYEPTPSAAAPVRRGDWVLIDLWGRLKGEDTIYADITWVGYAGPEAPPRQQEVFRVVCQARDAALSALQKAWEKGRVLQGWQVDRVARRLIAQAGYGKYFTHRLGHSLGRTVHGDAVNLDSWETRDTRCIIPGIGFTIEPGIYLPEFGVRSEIDVFFSPSGPQVTTAVQQSIVLIGERLDLPKGPSYNRPS
ncbi:MAG: M24 family metallopeptidase [Dehalococcoidia bacterium]|nr:M24 family metallopeptidase [Dehalococcoidia bacterium]MDW8119361.1 M24 family metallopeptidase [Chloroflexota bacterium]